MKKYSSFVKCISHAVLVVFFLVVSFYQLGSSQESTPTVDIATAHFSLHAIDNPETDYFYDVEVRPGTSVGLEALLVNWNTHPLKLRVYTTNAGNSPNGGFHAGKREEIPSGSTSWIDMPEQEITVKPDEQLTLPFTVTVPEGTAPGQYITAIVAETAEPLPIPGEDIIQHNIRYAISVSILVPGIIEANFEIGEPTITAEQFTIPITNTGNYLVRPEGQIEVRNSADKAVFSSPYAMGSVYAGSETAISFRLPVPLETGEYSLNISLTDSESGAEEELSNVIFSVQEERDSGIEIESVALTPNEGEFLYVGVDLVLVNTGPPTAVRVVIDVYSDGEKVDEIELSSNQVLISGENAYQTRFVPESPWKSGTYTFALMVYGGEPGSGEQMVLIDEELDAEIVVP